MGQAIRPTVLVIDDEPMVRAMLRTVLENAGYRVAEADDGVNGLEALKQYPFGIVITDIMMPNMEGIETIREIRRGFPDTGIVAISGGGTTGNMSYLRMAAVLGADRTLGKPMLVRDLLEAVSSIDRGRSSRAAARLD